MKSATYLKNCIKRADKNNMRIRVIERHQQTGYKVPKHDPGIRRSNEKEHGLEFTDCPELWQMQDMK